MAVCPAGHTSQTSDYCDTCGAVIGGSAIAAPAADPVAAAGPAVSGDPCPGCGAAQAGRFCEECGYDFELAALVPAATQVAASAPAGAGANALAAPDGEPDFDLDAALAAAEAQSQSGSHSGSQSAATLVAEPESESQAEAEAESTVIVLGTGSELDVIAVVTADQSYYQAQVERGDIVESEFPFPKFPGERRIALDVGQVRIGRASASRGLAVEIDLTGPPLDPAISHLHAQLLRQPDDTWTLVDLNSANGTRLNDAEEPIPAETEVPVSVGDRIHLGVWTTITLIEA
jgi:FHA domain